MPRHSSRSVPSYRLHKQSGQAIVTLTNALDQRRDVLLGRHGTAASRAECEAGGYAQPPTPAAPRTTPSTVKGTGTY